MDIQKTKQQIIEEALKNIPFDGWTTNAFEKAVEDLKMDKAVLPALFPRGIQDYLNYFSEWADDQMLEALESINADDLKIRAQIRMAVQKRIEVLTPHKEATRTAFKTYLNPQYARGGAKITWRTADKIWNWAGDTSTDYNQYTKRGLLSGVIATTMTYWMRDESGSNDKTFEFLNNRIENVVMIGQGSSKIIKPVESFIKNIVMPTVKSKMEKV
jgi:ubiquinone biosynthesis protein COQ9